MANRLDRVCHLCGNVGFDDGSDGFFYCTRCGSQAEDIIDTAVAEEDLIDQGDGAIYSVFHTRRRPAGAVKPEPLSQSQPQSQYWESLKTLDDYVAEDVKQEVVDLGGDGVGPTGPSDFGLASSKPLSYEDYYSEVRMRYVMGIQVMVQLQCKALVEKFQVNPVICGLAGTIWLRFVALTRVFDDNWADEVFRESESQKEGQSDDHKPRPKHREEPHNIHGERAVMIWYRSLSRTIPISYSLVISYLVCHIARESVLPTDILKWSLEGKLPYFDAFLEIEKQIGPSSSGCPLSSTLMFRPSQAIPLQKLESSAALVAQTIGLELPPVNFYLIATRYLRKLSLPIGKILPHACRIYEWSMPPELWLSANEMRLPTRVYVISILIVAIRILYNINGFGKWEMSLSSSSGSCPSASHKENKEATSNSDDFDASELLQNLEARFDELAVTYEYSKDLPSYLQYCKDVVFAGLEPSLEDREEEKIIEELWEFYENQKNIQESNEHEERSNSVLHPKRSTHDVETNPKQNKKIRDGTCTSSPSSVGGTSHTESSPKDQDLFPDDLPSVESRKDRAIRKMKSSMEGNRFCYIPPRTKVKVFDYLHYVRKKDEGAFTYAAHADYYILLRSFAVVAEVDIRTMHSGVLSFERRLGWLEKRIDHCLHSRPPTDSCEFCGNKEKENGNDEIHTTRSETSPTDFDDL